MDTFRLVSMQKKWICLILLFFLNIHSYGDQAEVKRLRDELRTQCKRNEGSCKTLICNPFLGFDKKFLTWFESELQQENDQLVSALKARQDPRSQLQKEEEELKVLQGQIDGVKKEIEDMEKLLRAAGLDRPRTIPKGELTPLEKRQTDLAKLEVKKNTQIDKISPLM